MLWVLSDHLPRLPEPNSMANRFCVWQPHTQSEPMAETDPKSDVNWAKYGLEGDQAKDGHEPYDDTTNLMTGIRQNDLFRENQVSLGWIGWHRDLCPLRRRAMASSGGRQTSSYRSRSSSALGMVYTLLVLSTCLASSPSWGPDGLW